MVWIFGSSVEFAVPSACPALNTTQKVASCSVNPVHFSAGTRNPSPGSDKNFFAHGAILFARIVGSKPHRGVTDDGAVAILVIV